MKDILEIWKKAYDEFVFKKIIKNKKNYKIINMKIYFFLILDLILAYENYESSKDRFTRIWQIKLIIRLNNKQTVFRKIKNNRKIFIFYLSFYVSVKDICA